MTRPMNDRELTWRELLPVLVFLGAAALSFSGCGGSVFDQTSTDAGLDAGLDAGCDTLNCSGTLTFDPDTETCTCFCGTSPEGKLLVVQVQLPLTAANIQTFNEREIAICETP